MKIYFFGWPGPIGGADTKLGHLLRLLRSEFDLTVVPSRPMWRLDQAGKRRLDDLNIRCALLPELPGRLDGWGVSLCNNEFAVSGQAVEARRRGLRLAWSNEMMCLFPAELGALTLGLFDTLLYVSAAQRSALEPQYRRIISGESRLHPFEAKSSEKEGWIADSGVGRKLRWVMTGNYVDPSDFPYRDRTEINSSDRPLVVGRLSRPDPAKFPADFPKFYEALGLHRVRFRVMGWSRELAARWPTHAFDHRWELLRPLAETAAQFLQSLDLFVYSLHPTCRESWGRAVVEAMLCGAVPLVPDGPEHHLRDLIRHGETGFLCADAGEFGRYARRLENEPALRLKMAARARVAAETDLCDAEAHREAWRRLFYGPTPA